MEKLLAFLAAQHGLVTEMGQGEKKSTIVNKLVPTAETYCKASKEDEIAYRPLSLPQ